METIQFTYGNFRYLIFQVNGQYYLLDRCPNHFIGYLFSPVNWFFYQKVYSITPSQYEKVQNKLAQAPKLSFLIPIAIGMGTLLSRISQKENRDIIKLFETEFSILTCLFTLLIGVILIYLLVKLFYSQREKSMISLLDSRLNQSKYYKFMPSKFNLKQLVGYVLVLWGLPFFGGWYYLFSGNLFWGLFTLFMLFFCFISSNVAFSTEANQFYKIVDIKEEH